MNSKEKLISVKNVSFKYKIRKSFWGKPEYFQPFNQISFDVFKGETLGIVGRNGAGKSTLLRLLAGIFKPDTGVIERYGNTVSLLALQAGFDQELSGRENAILNGMFLGYSKKEVKNRIEEIKKFSGLNEFFERPLKTFSTGMKARLGFSTAIYLTPDVLLLDEILSVGDMDFKKRAETEMKKKITIKSDCYICISF